jgi:hypothetical protein
VQYEAKKTGWSAAAVKKAVKKVGNARKRVEKRLGRYRAPGWRRPVWKGAPDGRPFKVGEFMSVSIRGDQLDWIFFDLCPPAYRRAG